MNRLEHTAHNLRLQAADNQLAGKLIESAPVEGMFSLGRAMVRGYYEFFGRSGRYEWSSLEDLAKESVVRGAMQRQWELQSLFALVRDHRPQRILEIGTGRGGTFFGWAHLAPSDGMLVSIDLPGGEFGGGYGFRTKKRLLSYLGPEQKGHILQADSHAANTLVHVSSLLNGEKFDFALIDGDHTEEGVTRDWECYRSFMRPGALVAFHDIVETPANPRVGVKNLWDRIAPNYEHIEIIEPPDLTGAPQWGGIGIVKLPN